MKRLSTCLLAALAVAAAFPALAVAQESKRIGMWGVIPNETRLRGKCLLVNLVASDGKQLIGALNSSEDVELFVADPAPRPVQLNDPANWKATVRINGKTYDDVEFSPFDEGSFNLLRFDKTGRRVSFEPDLMADTRLEITNPYFSAVFEIIGASKALDAFYECNGRRRPSDPPAPSILETLAEKAASSLPLASGEDAEGDDGDIAEERRVFGGGQDGASEAGRIGQAMQGMAGSSPVFAQYRCSFTASQFLGTPRINGEDEPDIMTLTIAEDGSGEVNGGRFQPAYADGSVAGGNLRSLAYRVSDIMTATNTKPENAAPPLMNMTPDEMRAYQVGIAIWQGLGQEMVAGRQRYLTVSLADDVVRFLDLTPQNQAANIATLECLRTQ